MALPSGPAGPPGMENHCPNGDLRCPLEEASIPRVAGKLSLHLAASVGLAACITLPAKGGPRRVRIRRQQTIRGCLVPHGQPALYAIVAVRGARLRVAQPSLSTAGDTGAGNPILFAL
ncbi:hypothetical protein NDU88_008008 [Pleurodeles waltl]|uniref:Uncharacterized protein n=1 Tax=Pleurodeles waltl TaxID=8319 RepID=A0AAV7RUU3_PLEWA|nr:hypothetical protein NDU88_008008 [Pleurodeles waltl]